MTRNKGRAWEMADINRNKHRVEHQRRSVQIKALSTLNQALLNN